MKGFVFHLDAFGACEIQGTELATEKAEEPYVETLLRKATFLENSHLPS